MAANKKTMQKNGKKNGKGGMALLAAAYTFALIVAAIAIIAVSSMLLPGIGRFAREGPGHFGGGQGAMMAPPPEQEIAFLEENFALRAGLSILNVALAVYLLYIYVKDYFTLKTSFTLGIIAVLFSFLLYALTSSPLLRILLGQYGIASSLSFVPMLFSAIGLIIFAKLGSE